MEISSKSLKDTVKEVESFIHNFVKNSSYTISILDFNKMVNTLPIEPKYGVYRSYEIPLHHKHLIEPISLMIQVWGLGKKYDVNVYRQLTLKK
jgi:hypothetical protein